MVQLINIPQLQYPGNGVDFSPITNALMYYRKGMTEAQQWDVARRAGERAAAGDMTGAAAEAFRGGNPALGLQLGNEPLQNALLQAQAGHLSAQTGLLGAQTEAARSQLEQDRMVREWLLGRGGTPGAPAASATAPSTAAPAPMPAPSMAPPVSGPSISLGEGINRPPARPLAAPGAAAAPGLQWALPKTDNLAAQPTALPPPAAPAPAAPSWMDMIVSPAGAAEPARAPARSINLPLTAPQSPAAPEATQPAPTPQQAGPSNFQSILSSMPREKQIAAMLLLAKKDYPELAKLLSDSVVQEQTAAATARGKAAGEAQAGLPQALQSGQQITGNIDAILRDPNLGNIVGWRAYNPATYLPYSPQGRDSVNRVQQLQGQAFMQAYQGLRGGGQITEKEGEKATQAIGRLMDLGQTEEGYRRALLDARREIHSLMNLARERAGQRHAPYQVPPDLLIGTGTLAPGRYRFDPATGNVVPQ